MRVRFFFGERFHGFDQAQSGPEQHVQFLAEQQQRKTRTPARQRQRQPVMRIDSEHRITLPLDAKARLRGGHGVDPQRNDTALIAEGFDVETHDGYCQLVMSAASPVPPGWPSLPSERRS